ncbi:MULTISPECIES: Bax inhibitor-1/YccA family protein [unclassified Gilliamella]|uniref:Bax inhibitor-1/YccA family protein n=1 Tax=unclassified Gilliamella TaxID=2685620 RepID=UPI001C697261|nr:MULTISPECIES: Bax inhibitor-1/YccA family protein [unclassified Gilliamella]MCX8600332.1 Bax inhibitor-1/YccA family protein [Gilliamella sp. B3722]MCX8609328.1 Bax inhibitor-1/YccA family protein [Gilliamella sp. B3771]MCX8609547.1 Bax inhibitor-1/YccA family protein [Gilliamella sp. B3891]MCX8612364.1 Bax inhibitor-1/YccA family protein [Gilliamella sp. B3773]MCX8615784.1 Bax inhibitor-1/YccA family protein [Gilliamella sp. B3770]
MTSFTPNGSIIEKSNSKIQTYLSHVYGWMAVGILLTGLVSWYTANSSLLNLLFDINSRGQVSLSFLSIALIVAELAIVFCLSPMIDRFSGKTATTLFMLYSVLNGITLSSIFICYTHSSIASVFFITAGMFAALAFYGYTTKRDLTSWGSFLYMGLIGIIIASIVNFFMGNQALMWAITYIGVFIFAGLTAYDTQKLKEFGEHLSQDDANVFRRYVILGALSLYLDFINLFILLLRIFADRR